MATPPLPEQAVDAKEAARLRRNAYDRARYATDPSKVQAANVRWRAAHPEQMQAIRGAWQAANERRCAEYRKAYRVENREGSKAYRTANKERIRQLNAARYQANKAKVKALGDAWRLANPEQRKATAAAWRAANPDKVRAIRARRRARARGAGGRFTIEDIQAIFKAQRGKCAHPWCRVSLKERYDIDHITPIVRGGSSFPRNLQLLCCSCNRKKNAKDPIDFARENGLLV